MIDLAESKFGVIVADPPWSYSQFRDTANGASCAAMETRGVADICRVQAGQRWGDKKCVLILWGTGPKIDEAVFTERAWGFQHKTMIPWLKTAPTRAQLSAGGIGIWVQAKAEYVLFSTRGNVGSFYTVGDRNEKGKRKFTRLRPRPPGCLVGPREHPVFWDPNIEEDPDFWNALTTNALLAPGVKGGKNGEINHSKKPLSLYEYAESFPGDILELYARAQPVASFTEERKKRWTCLGWDLGHELGPWGVRERNEVSGGLF